MVSTLEPIASMQMRLLIGSGKGVSRSLTWMLEPVTISQRDGLYRVRLGPFRNAEEASAIADKVRRDGRLVSEADVAEARAHGADDQAIHDTVLIAAAFCMYNRYVDGLATVQPNDPGMYEQMGKHLAEKGYTTPSVRQAVEV